MSGSLPIYKKVPWWHLLRIACICALCVFLIKPLMELRAYNSSVTFLKVNKATLAWDPPSQGVVDHYVVEVTITRVLDGPSNYVSWVEYHEAKDTRLTINTRHGYTYTFRVKAVGPSGNESPYSEERVTAICDCKKPVLQFNPFEQELDISAGSLELTGSFEDETLESITVNGIKAKIDVTTKTWSVTVPVNKGLNKFTVIAKDYAGNVNEHEFEVYKKVDLPPGVVEEPIVIVDSTPVSGSDLYVMGTPGFPGIYVCQTPLQIKGYIDPSFTIPASVRLNGYIGRDLIATFPQGMKKLEFKINLQRHTTALVPHPIDLDYRAGLVGPVCPYVADFDQDNEMEILLTTGGGQLFVLKDEGDERRSLWLQTRIPHSSHAMAPGSNPFLIDYDNDLEYEIVIKSDEEHLSLLKSRDQIWQENSTIFSGSTIRSFWFVDWNNDRKKDLAVASDGPGITVFENHGSDAAPVYDKATVVLDLPGRAQEASFALCDWNGDGINDVVSQRDDGELAVWLGKNSPSAGFSPAKGLGISAQDLQGFTLYPSVADWNDDGFMDIIVGTDSGRLYLLLGN